MSAPVAILCSGQGGQHREMFVVLEDRPETEAIFKAAAPLLAGVDPRRFVREAGEDALFGNRAGQILCCTQALAAWSVLGPARPADVVMAGYSVGELAAWGCAGVFTPSQVLGLAARRADLMEDAAPPGAGLAAIVGLPRPTLERVLQAHGAFLAISNAPDSVVIGGTSEALDACLAEAIRSGAKTARRLRVAVPSHTELLEPAATAFAAILAGEGRNGLAAGVRLLCGLDGDRVRNLEHGLDKLAQQIASTINWSDCLDGCIETGASTFLELGPGAALCRMVEKRSPGLSARSVDEFRSVEGLRSWLACH